MFPLAGLTWLILGIMVTYTILHEQQMRRNAIENQLRNINATVIAAYDRGADLQETVDFLSQYYDNSTLDALRITVLDDSAKVVAIIGQPIRIEDRSHQMIPELVQAETEGEATGIRNNFIDDRESMFNVITSSDGTIRSISTTPLNYRILRALSYDSTIWLVVLVLAILATIVAWLTASKIHNNVEILKKFARLAAEGKIPNPDLVNLSHDELGDVSRQILQLYRDKDKALRRSEHEHTVAMRATLEQARIKRQMANNVNHELKTPVGIIKGYLDTINSDPDMPDEMRRNFLTKAQEHADRLSSLLKDVSSITRLDEASDQVALSDFDFHDLVYALANDLEVSHINGNLEFEYAIPFDCWIRGNYTMLTNALLNLIRNAAKYSHGTIMSLDLIGENPTHYTFRFADNGNGVAEVHIPRLFDRFYRADEGRARKSGGTGLGLPIVKSTITALGGTIEVRNAIPHGLEFIFTLPRVDKTAAQNAML